MTKIRGFLSIILFFFVFPTAPIGILIAADSDFMIDADFPGGNIHVDAVDGDTVRHHQELRDTEGFWFHWSFRVRGAQKKTLHFEFSQEVIGVRGPAVSRDGGLTWEWNGALNADMKRFDFTFGPNDSDVLFAYADLYTQATLERFLKVDHACFPLKKSVLCRSRHGRDVERLDFGNPDNIHHFGVLLLGCHHAQESTASYVMEGVVEEIFSGSAEGDWLKDHVVFLWIPFMDKDGVEEGDQGKNRRPHDHNRDYRARIYPEVRAVTELVPIWSRGKRIMVCDFHSPGSRGENNEKVYFPGSESPEMTKRLAQFSRLLEIRDRDGLLPYRETFNLPFGKDWNVGTGDENLMKSTQWGASLPNVLFSASLETPFANASGAVVSADSARDFGHRYARALYDFFQEILREKKNIGHP